MVCKASWVELLFLAILRLVSNKPLSGEDLEELQIFRILAAMEAQISLD